MDENVTVAQVRPESTLYCLKNIPLDNTYQNTIAFNNLTAQRQYFSRHVKYTFNEMTYIRQNGNTIRVEKTADDMLDVNYLMFQNSAYGSKWFYAFVTQINYINDVTTELIYEIDVMQTWFFDFYLKESFQNSAYGSKWFYAFVTQINYINDVTTELIYEIDVMQTWFFDFYLKESFVV